MDNSRIALISIGTELTNGTIQDKYGRYIAEKLSGMGFEIRKIVFVPDDSGIAEELKTQISCCDCVILTGGLGPTSDDITREMLAITAGVDLLFRDDVWETIVSGFDVHKNKSNKKQAFVPEHFTTIPNGIGTAPGLKGSIGNTVVYALPGPPRELRAMFDRYVIPDLQIIFKTKEADFFEVTCFLLCESELEDACVSYEQQHVSWGTRAGENSISLYLRGGIEDEREKFFQYLQHYFGKERIKKGKIDVSGALVTLLAESRSTLSCAESCTGGLCAKMLTDVPGSSNVFFGGVVSYTNSAKHLFLKVEEKKIQDSGAVSSDTAEAMAQSIQVLTGTDYGISFTGFAGPGGGSKENPVGTVWIGISSKDGQSRTFHFVFRGSRERVRRKAVLAGFLLLEIWLTDKKRLDSYGKWQYI